MTESNAMRDALKQILGWCELRSEAHEFPIERIEKIASEALNCSHQGQGKAFEAMPEGWDTPLNSMRTESAPEERTIIEGVDVTDSYPISFNDGQNRVPGIPEGTIPQVSSIKEHSGRYATAYVVRVLCEYAEMLEAGLRAGPGAFPEGLSKKVIDQLKACQSWIGGSRYSISDDEMDLMKWDSLQECIDLISAAPSPAEPCRYHDHDHEACETYSGQVPCDPAPVPDQIKLYLDRVGEGLERARKMVFHEDNIKSFDLYMEDHRKLCAMLDPIRLVTQGVKGEPDLTAWVLFDDRGGAKHIKKFEDGSLAIFDSEPEAETAKCRFPRTDYKRVYYYRHPSDQQEQAEPVYRCHKCLQQVPGPEPFAMYVRCPDCQIDTAATIASNLAPEQAQAPIEEDEGELRADFEQHIQHQWAADFNLSRDSEGVYENHTAEVAWRAYRFRGNRNL